MKAFYLLSFLLISCLANSEQFNFKFYTELVANNEDKNLFFSSYSLKMALSMLSEGCKGQSAQQIFTVCSISPDSQTRHQEMESTIASINAETTNFELKTANAIWPALSSDFNLEKDFENVIENVYNGITEALNYNYPEQATKFINNWVSEETNNKITDLIPEGAITFDTRLVITNCIYFKAQWKYQFNPQLTFETKFWLDDATTTQIEMMYQFSEKEFKYYENQLMQLIQLPYQGEKASMYVILPKYDIITLEQNLDQNQFLSWRSALKLENVDLYLPKFKFEWTETLIKPLEEMGITNIFDFDADLSGIDGQRDLTVSDIIQKALIDVNEYGTEAAAATAIIISKTSLPENMKNFNANHPFIFMIMHEETEQILFMGKLMKPSNYQIILN